MALMLVASAPILCPLVNVNSVISLGRLWGLGNLEVYLFTVLHFVALCFILIVHLTLLIVVITIYHHFL